MYTLILGFLKLHKIYSEFNNNYVLSQVKCIRKVLKRPFDLYRTLIYIFFNIEFLYLCAGGGLLT